MWHAVLSVFALVLLTGEAKPITSNATSGLDVIQFPALSFAANFQKDPLRLIDEKAFFTSADKTAPNFFGAILTGDATSGFTVENTDYGLGKNNLPPLLAFDVWGLLAIGVGLPPWDNGETTLNVYTFTMNGETSRMGDSFFLPGYNPYNIIIDRSQVDSPDGVVPCYVAGFSPLGFYVMALYLNTTSLQFQQFNQNLDIWYLSNYIMDSACFDLYSAVTKPRLWIDYTFMNRNLVISMEGRCGSLIVIPLTWTVGTNNPFGIPWIHPTFTLNDIDSAYVAASTFQPSNGVYPGKLFYLIQAFNRSTQPLLMSFNIQSHETDGAFLNNIDPTTWSNEVHMAYANYSANGQQVMGLYIFAKGSYLAGLYSTNEWNAGSLGQFVSQAIIPQAYTAVSSVFFYSNYLYFSVNSPQGAVARISVKNFCPVNCGINGYCNAGVCACQSPYILVSNASNANASSYCDNPTGVRILQREIQDQVGIVFFSIITACVTFIGMVGWASWFKIRD